MPDNKEYHLEVLGTCMTNPTPDSQHDAKVEAKYLWSYAQEEALVALSEQKADKCWHLITDPERRAKRIAARYADLYFQSNDKSQGQVQLYWVALAAFVVKDIVEAFRYAREEVLKGGWRNFDISKLGSMAITGASPYEHAQRVYEALAKGNLWLFMDIYPWMWFFLEYGFNKDGTVNKARLEDAVTKRDWATFQEQSKKAVEELPYGPNWTKRLLGRIEGDVVFKEASKYFDTMPSWGTGMDGGYGNHLGQALQAHRYVKQHVANYDKGYRMPASKYWGAFSEAYYVMEEERKELKRVAGDSAAMAKLKKIRNFKTTSDIQNTYQFLIKEATSSGKLPFQKKELAAIAMQEQLNILQPLIYEDKSLINTMDKNHQMSRRYGSWLSPHYKVVYSAKPKIDDEKFTSEFDKPTNYYNQVWEGTKKSLPNPTDRMDYVNNVIAPRFNQLMANKRAYMEAELQTIRGWLNA